MKLEAEIQNADQKTKSAITALEIIKSANIELKKELLLTRERKLEIIERVKTSIKKYEGVWDESKIKYENIPFIKNFIQTKNKSLTLRENIDILIERSRKVIIERNKKRIELANLDRKLLLDIAAYFAIEKPKTLLAIKDKTDKINELNKDIKALIKHHNVNISSTTKNNFSDEELDNKIHEKINVIENSWLNLNKSNNVMLPNIELNDIDLDNLAVKLDQFKRDDLVNPLITKKTDSILDLEINSNSKILKPGDNNETNFVNYIGNSNGTTKNYSEKKLIHIIDDIKLDKLQSYNLVTNVKPGELQDINMIKASTSVEGDIWKLQDKPGEIIEQEQTEKIDSTIKHSAAVLVPPTQFLDLNECAEEVSMVPVETKTQESLSIQDNKPQDDKANEATDTQTNVSTASDESFSQMKNTILKKHNLDLSPQFTYSKKQMLNLNHEEKVIKSKFFEESHTEINDNNVAANNKDTTDKDTVLTKTEHVISDSKGVRIPKELLDNIHDKIICSSPNPTVKENIEFHKLEVPVSGFLFNHGPGSIPESLDVSMTTTGYEECDADYPQCEGKYTVKVTKTKDPSLLLSPKAELPETNENNGQALSQEVPNFLSGLRKTGFSFFGSMSNNSGSKPEGKNDDGNFNFTFGGTSENRKTRGGLFSMFN